jgi:protein O-GlcNAc transferase
MDINDKFQLALEQYQAGNLQKAERICLEILKVQPDNAEVMHFLGVIFYGAGNYDIAIENINNSLLLNPINAAAYYDLGNAYFEKSHFEDAITYYQKAIEINPNFAEAFNNLGLAMQDNGRLDYAIKNYQKAIDINPSLVEAYNNLGLAFYEKELYDEASKCYSEAIRLNPHFADPYNNFGNILEKKWQLDEALVYYQKALMLNPKAESYFNVGRIFHEKEQLDKAMDHYQKVLQLNPNLIEAYLGIGYIFDYHNKRDEAIVTYDKALAKNPDFIKARWAKCMSQLQTIYLNETSIKTSRKRYFEELIKLRDIISLQKPHDIEEAADAIGFRQPFYLAYQGFNDRELQQLYGDLVCKIMSLKYPEFSKCLSVPHHLVGEPLRVGIVSGHFYEHSVWKIPIKGWIENINKQKFNLYGYYTGKNKDNVTEIARNCFDHFVEDIYSYEKLCQTIKDDNLHILIYPEIGMDPFAARLASLRLAPIQCTTWGHPETSGLPTIDYFLSSDLMEPHNANDHYTEELIRLPNLSIYYTPWEFPPVEANRDTFGLRHKAILFHCCQSLFKFLPKYDIVFVRIAQAVEDCQFLFSSHPKSHFITEQFRSRIYRTFNHFNLNAEDYFVFLPFLEGSYYEAINCISDVFLDPIGWSGCNSILEAINRNLPVVTYHSKLMRGREGYAILSMMGLTEIIPQSIDDYINIAIRLGKDPEWRRYISQKIAHNKHLIYCDRKCIIELENFIDQIVKKALELDNR